MAMRFLYWLLLLQFFLGGDGLQIPSNQEPQLFESKLQEDQLAPDLSSPPPTGMRRFGQTPTLSGPIKLSPSNGDRRELFLRGMFNRERLTERKPLIPQRSQPRFPWVLWSARWTLVVVTALVTIGLALAGFVALNYVGRYWKRTKTLLQPEKHFRRHQSQDNQVDQSAEDPK